jgi:nucleotide-binding universal stress UspA family protein
MTAEGSRGALARPVLVAVDGSPRSDGVLREALRLAEAARARVLVLHVVTLPPTLPASVWPLSPGELADRCLKAAREDLEALVERHAAGAVARIVLRVGTPWREICDVAIAEDAALVVIGAHGYGAAERVLGTTAARVVDHVDRSVFVVRAP